jgi:PhzF family phenazine biosynthesis protein
MLKMFLADAFTGEPFGGNPAGVCLLEKPQEDEWMQQVAMEMNQAETAFLLPENGEYRLRWFTPVAEVDLCGHATLASAHILWQQGFVALDREIRFLTRSGLLTASRREDGWIRLDFPLETAEPCETPAELAEALGVTPIYVGQNRMDYLIEVESEEILTGLKPDFGRLKQVAVPRGFIVTSRSGQSLNRADFVSRCFFPAIGIDEDPVTGSAHCALGPYWANKLGNDHLIALQISKREGLLQLQLTPERIVISGQAVTTLQGQFISK